MANDNATLRLALDDQVSGPAESVAEKMDKLRGRIEGGRKELSQLQRSMRDMKRSGSVSEEVIKSTEERIDALRKRVGEANAEYIELGGNFRKVRRPAAEGAKGTSKFAEGMRSLGFNTGRAGGRLQSFAGFAKGGAGAAMAAKVAVAAMAAALVLAFVALTKYALATANAAREERLRFEVLGHLRGRSKTAIADSEALQKAINGVAASTGGARKEVAGYAESAYRAGLRGAALEHAVRGATIKGAALGERYGKSFVFMSASAARAGQDVSKLADDAERRFGGLAQRRLMSFGNLFRRYKEGLASWFMDIDIDPLLKSLSRFVSLFSTSHEYGRQASRFYGWFFSWFAKGLSWLVDGVVWFAETALLWTYKAMNAFKRMAGAIYDVAIFVKEAFQGIFTFFEEFEFPSFSDMAKSVGSGIVKGFSSMMGSVWRAGGNLAKSAAEGFKKFAGIRSPSRLFAEYGGFVSKGFEIGVEDGTSDAQEAVRHLVDVPRFPASDSSGEASSSLGGVTVSVSIGDIITQATDGSEVLESLRLRLGDVLRDALAQEGIA